MNVLTHVPFHISILPLLKGKTDAVWSASVPLVQTLWLENGYQASRGQSPVSQVVESRMAGQAAGIPGAGEAVVAECVCDVRQ